MSTSSSRTLGSTIWRTDTFLASPRSSAGCQTNGSKSLSGHWAHRKGRRRTQVSCGGESSSMRQFTLTWRIAMPAISRGIDQFNLMIVGLCHGYPVHDNNQFCTLHQGAFLQPHHSLRRQTVLIGLRSRAERTRRRSLPHSSRPCTVVSPHTARPSERARRTCSCSAAAFARLHTGSFPTAYPFCPHPGGQRANCSQSSWCGCSQETFAPAMSLADRSCSDESCRRHATQRRTSSSGAARRSRPRHFAASGKRTPHSFGP